MDVQRRLVRCILVLLEPGIGIVVEVVGILPYLPRDVEVFVDLKCRFPCEGIAGIRSSRSRFTPYFTF